MFTAAMGLALICLGGLVTSHEAGMAVPDWPNTFGYNMFFFPISKWVGGIFYEHTHRLLASAVGFLTIVLASWLWAREERKWLRWLGAAALGAVILQGVLGGLRVTWMKDELGIFHAALAQLFFALLCSIALFTSPWWRQASSSGINPRDLATLRSFCITGSLLIFLQLLIGATMRHQHAGLAIPDFPTAYGQLWPATDADSVDRYNQLRVETTGIKAITSFQVVLQMVHRIGAVIICALVAAAARFALLRLRQNRFVCRLLLGWAFLIGCQFLLGAATIWTNKSADLATAHVAVGALSLVNAVVIVLVSSRYLWRESVPSVTVEVAVGQRVAGRTVEVPT